VVLQEVKMILALIGLLGLSGWFFLFSFKGVFDVPRSIRGGGGGDDDDGGSVEYTQPPEYDEQMEMFQDIQKPWIYGQSELYKDIFEPQMRELGGLLGDRMKQPLTLPEDVWSNLWQKGQSNVLNQYDNLRDKGSERAAGRGMLGQGPTENYMQNLDLQQAKSIDDMAVEMAMMEWNEKKMAQQQATGNMMNYLQMQPAFNIPLPGSQPFTQAGNARSATGGWGGAASGAVSGAYAGSQMGLGGYGTAGGAILGGIGGYY